MILFPAKSLMLADTTISVPTSLDKSARMAMSGGSFAVIIGVLFVVVVVVFWLLLIRKPSRPHGGRGILVDGPSGGSRRRKRRHRSRTPRTANPSLAQTGGLPPRGAGEEKQPPQ